MSKIKRPKPVRTPTILQMEAVECGAAALAIILGYYGRFVPLEELRIACGVSRDGSKASNVLKAARKYGLKAKGFSKTPEKLMLLKMPCILFWNFNHFLVLEGFKGERVYLSDPAMGRYQVTYQEFDEAFTGVVLTFEPDENFQKGNDTTGLLSALGSRIKGSKLAISFVVLLSLFLVIPGLIIPSFTQIFIDQFLVNQMSEWVIPLLFAMGVVMILHGFLVYLQQYYLLRLRTKLALTTSSTFLWHILKLPIQFFSQRYSGEIGGRVSLNNKIASILSGRLATAFLNVIVIVFFAALMFTYDVALTLIGIAVVSVNAIILRLASRAQIDGSRRLINEKSKLLGTTMAGLKMIESLKASGRETDFFTNWAGHFVKSLNAQQELGWLSRKLNIFPSLLTGLNTIILLGLGALKVMDGEITLGMLVAFLYLMNSFVRPVNQLVSLGNLLQQTKGDMNRIDDVLRYEEAPDFKKQTPTEGQTTNSNLTTRPNSASNLKLEKDKQAAISSKLIGYVEVKKLTFGYSQLAPPLIRNFNMSLTPGSRVALVGGSGSGKSTIAKLLTGLYQHWSGDILFDGKERYAYDRYIVNNSLAVVDQEVLLFAGTVKENISFWDNTMSEQNIIRAAKDANIHDTIASRKGAYDSKVLEGGRNFSGGQRQRLEIARALAVNPSILVLDEGTSALDPQSEKIVMDSIRRRGCTCIVVAHRLSTIRDCDEIIVLKFGKVVQRGTHEELIEQKGMYADLIRAE